MGPKVLSSFLPEKEKKVLMNKKVLAEMHSPINTGTKFNSKNISNYFEILIYHSH
jgi:hypothetical protein